MAQTARDAHDHTGNHVPPYYSEYGPHHRFEVRLDPALGAMSTTQLQPRQRSNTPDALTHIRIFIETHIMDADLSPEMIARQFGMSRASLYRVIKPLGGIKQYIRTRRLHYAADALNRGGEDARSISRLAFDLGFGSENAFRRAFKELFGMSPSKARAVARTNN